MITNINFDYLMDPSSMFYIFSIEGVDGEVVLIFLLIFIIFLIVFTKLLTYTVHAIDIARTERNVSLIVQPPQPSYNRSEEPCPICFSSITFAVETDCYHLYCGCCILGVIQYARHRKITCPVCRAQVSMLYPVFTVSEYDSDRNSDIAHTRENLISEIQEYNHLFSGGSRTILQAIFELPIYIRRIWRSFNNPNDIFVRTQMRTLLYLILFCVILYIIFPFDLLPEVYFGVFGFLDDFLVLAISLMYLANFYRSLYLNLQLRNQLG